MNTNYTHIYINIQATLIYSRENLNEFCESSIAYIEQKKAKCGRFNINIV